MSYAAIIVHVEADAIGDHRLRLAAQLAEQFGASLVGVGAEMFEPPIAAAAGGYFDGQILEVEAKLVEGDLQLAEARFREAARSLKTTAEWRCSVGLPADVLAFQSRSADLIVAGPRRKEPWGIHNHADPGDLLVRAGRPILIAPEGTEALDASRVVVAWKDTRESRRALSDALPFLRQAQNVLLVEVDEERDTVTEQSRLPDVLMHLARYGVDASSMQRASGKATAAETLLAVAHAEGAGLLVAGGYGHTRLGEWVFGGVTDDLLSGAGKAILLSH